MGVQAAVSDVSGMLWDRGKCSSHPHVRGWEGVYTSSTGPPARDTG